MKKYRGTVSYPVYTEAEDYKAAQQNLKERYGDAVDAYNDGEIIVDEVGEFHPTPANGWDCAIMWVGDLIKSRVEERERLWKDVVVQSGRGAAALAAAKRCVHATVKETLEKLAEHIKKHQEDRKAGFTGFRKACKPPPLIKSDEQFDKNCVCNSQDCPLWSKCANHSSAGDYRTEGGITPELSIDAEGTLTCTQKQLSNPSGRKFTGMLYQKPKGRFYLFTGYYDEPEADLTRLVWKYS